MKILIIGCGKFGSKRLKVAQNLGLDTYILETDAQRKEELKRDFKALKNENIFTNFEEVKQRDFDLVIISSPNHFHLEHIKEVCQLFEGKVLCEKPIVKSSEELSELVSLSEDHKNKINMGENFIHFPVTQYLLHEVDYGQVNEIEISIGHNTPELLNDWNKEKNQSGGGTLIDNGIHVINFLCHIFDSIEVLDSSFNLDTQSSVEKEASVILNSGNTKISVISSWQKSEGYCHLKYHFNNGKLIEGEITTDKIVTKQNGKENSIELKPKYSLEEELRNILSNSHQSNLNTNIRAMQLLFNIYNHVKDQNE